MPLDPVIGAQIIRTGSDILGTLLGSGARKRAQREFDTSVDDLGSLAGQPLFDIGKITAANRQASFPRINELAKSTSKQFNFDQPRAQEFFLSRLFDLEATQLPGQLEREGTGRSRRDLDIRSMIARLRGSQLG